MKKNTFLILISNLLALAILSSACSALTGAPTPLPEAISTESPSGMVTAEGKLLPSSAVKLAFAQGGVIDEVLVKQGDTVAAGSVLARLMGVKTAQADLAAAQAQYDLAYNAAMTQDRSNRSQDLYKTQTGDFTLPMWYYNQQEQLTAAQSAVDLAQTGLTKAQERLTNKMQTSGAEFIKTETALAAAQADYDVAKNLKDRIKTGKQLEDLTRRELYKVKIDTYLKSKDVTPKYDINISNMSQDLSDEAQKIFDDAISALDDAQTAFDDASTTDGAQEIQKARAQMSISQERYYTALDYLRSLKTGPESESLIPAQTALNKAKAALELFELRAPIGGTILNFDPAVGEVASPGVPVAFLADISRWTVETKDLAEIDIAQVAIGQSVTVKLDALPGEEFQGSVTDINPVGQEYLGDMTYKVTITLEQADPRFLWNMTANVDIKAK
jgi:multidrug efflux pump subunit AcrA (membrane-fusion protein)